MCFFYYVICNVTIGCCCHVFISSFRCSELVKLRSLLYAFMNQFFPISELSAFDSAFNPFLSKVFAAIFTLHLAIFPSKLPSFCFFLLLKFLYFLIILLALSCVALFFRPVTFLARVFLGSFALICLIVTFDGKFHLLTISYLNRNDVPFGNRTLYGVVRPLSSIFCLIVFSFFFHQFFFLIKVLQFH